MAAENPQLKALGFLKDWSNYLLVTTVAAVGWVSTKGVVFEPACWRGWCLGFLAISIAFGIFTLALIPLVAEELNPDTRGKKSIYDITPKFYLIYRWWEIDSICIKHVCWVQHVAFLIAIVVYALFSRPGA